MSIRAILRAAVVAGYVTFVGVLAWTCFHYRAATQSFVPTEEVVGRFHLAGNASSPRGRIDGRAVEFDAGAFGTGSGERSKVIPDGAIVRVSIAKVQTAQGILPLVVRVQEGDNVVLSSTADEFRSRWSENTQFIAVMFAVLGLTPVVLVFSWTRRRPR